MVGLGGLVIATILGLTALALYLSQQGPGGTVALEVGDASYTTDYISRRARLLNIEYTAQGQSLSPLVVLNQAVLLVRQEAVVRQRASTLEIGLTPEELDAAIAIQLGLLPEARDAFLTVYQQRMIWTRLSYDEWHRMVEAQTLQHKVLAKLDEQLPATVDQAKVRLILVRTQAEAQAILKQLERGESFADLARQLSLDNFSRDAGGERGWIPRGLLGDAFDAATFALEPGQRSGPIVTNQGAYIIEAEEKAGGRELEREQRTALAEQAFARWLNENLATLPVSVRLDEEKVNWALEQAFPPARAGGG